MDREYEHILYETTDDGITIITLNRPEVRNAFNRKMGDELQAALDNFYDTEDEKFCVLTGAGSSFCAGEDLKNINLDLPRLVQEENTRKALRSYQAIILNILGIQKPIVALLNGSAAGAGLSIALACDERFAIDRIRFFPGFATLGLMPDAGMIPLLERLVGYSEAMRWLKPGFSFNLEDYSYSGAPHIAVQDRIIAMGHILVSPRDGDLSRLTDVVFAYAREFMKLRSLDEFACTKFMTNSMMIRELSEHYFHSEVRYQVELEQGDDFREGLAAFREKRAPKFNQKRVEG